MLFKNLLLGLLILLMVNNTKADEGMWVPMLLKKYTIQQMEAKGFKLTAEDIYNINQISLKDGVVGLVRMNNPFHHFCSGVMISNQGLMLTNHHCGYDYIQSHSSVENDYLTNGFWAMNKGEELTNENLGVCFLNRMEEVTEQVLANTTEKDDEFTRDSIIESNCKIIEKETAENGLYYTLVQPFFGGNEYYLSVYKIYTDIRLVGAPPSAIGKFGGDTDNWMWPRHTGDFSLFRIYANANNEPATFDTANIPYKPAKTIEIATSGIKKDDFTMVMGYPGTTTEYLPSYAVSMQKDFINPARINIRTQSLNIIKEAMVSDPNIRIQYSSKAAGIANGWKKWIGENKGLDRLNAVAVKQEQENNFQKWVMLSDSTKEEYQEILNQYKELYSLLTPYNLNAVYFNETLFESEIVDFAGKFNALDKIKEDTDEKKADEIIQNLKSDALKFYKDYDIETDKRLFKAYVDYFIANVSKEFHPEALKLIDSKFKGNTQAFTQHIFNNSMFPSKDKMNQFLDSYSVKKAKALKKDPLYLIYNQALDVYLDSINPTLKITNKYIRSLHKNYIKGLREFQPEKTFYPDANSTFRVSYGKVDGYTPMDAVTYHYQTTLDGIIEKDIPTIYDYNVPERMKNLYQNKEYGNYANSDGTMPVCFIASNHTTGGYSGSPVFNAYGQLIGINFDRNWEGTMSDIMYDPEMCRNIILDVRYILFVIDKFAGAGYLLDEMELHSTTK